MTVGACLLLTGCSGYDVYQVHHIQNAEARLVDPPSSVAVPPRVQGFEQFVSLRLRYSEAPAARYTTPTDTPHHADGIVPDHPRNYGVHRKPVGAGVEYRFAAESPEYFGFDFFAGAEFEPQGWEHVETFGLGGTLRTRLFNVRLSPSVGVGSVSAQLRDSIATHDLDGTYRNSMVLGARGWTYSYGSFAFTVWPPRDALTRALTGGVAPFVGFERTALWIQDPFEADYHLKKLQWVAGIHLDRPQGRTFDLSASRATLRKGAERSRTYRAEARFGTELSPLAQNLVEIVRKALTSI
jgi:hypothetical protein